MEQDSKQSMQSNQHNIDDIGNISQQDSHSNSNCFGDIVNIYKSALTRFLLPESNLLHYLKQPIIGVNKPKIMIGLKNNYIGCHLSSKNYLHTVLINHGNYSL